MTNRIEHIYIDLGVKTHPLTRRIIRALPGTRVTLVRNRKTFLRESEKIPLSLGKRMLWLSQFKGPLLKPCPGTGEDYLCCRYYTINAQTNCPLDCSYCILQNFLNFPLLTVYVNVSDVFREIDSLIRSEPGRLFRMGTGELTDSLALDPLTKMSEGLIHHALKRRMILEIKTKTDFIDHLPSIPKHNVLISWSLNPQEIVRGEEHKAAPLKSRLKAAKAAIKKGYRLAFHFDPLLLFKGWETKYAKLITQLTREIPEKEVMWISMGSFRYPPPLRRILDKRFPKSKILSGEFIKGLDGKMRYFRLDRTPLYRTVHEMIRKKWTDVFVYFCMENSTVWNDVMGASPRNNEHLDQMFQESIERRFGGFKC
ncbi:MAG TPA: hypothetical protein PLX96_06045 [Candidatus Omnitrophota bacterium]|nr:hypothetical protein [Candidatus Omnitrophota bacterium]